MPKENPNSARITVQMPPDEKEFFEAIAEGNGRSTSAEALQRLRHTYQAEFEARQAAKRGKKKK